MFGISQPDSCVYWSPGTLAKMRNEVCPRPLA